MYPAGDHKSVDIRIARKAFRTAVGTTCEIFRDLSLEIVAGEVRALVGPSGCGKTTLLRIIVGLDEDYEGSVTLPNETRFGMVFQEPRLLPWRNVFENLRLAAPGAREADLVKVATDLGLAAHLDHYPGELSLGLARRVALARALAVDPDLLVLDEPFVSLDLSLAARLRGELAALVERRKTTTILVTHDLDEAIGLADSITLLAGQPTHILGNVAIDSPRRAQTPERAAETKRLINAVMAKAA
jgi:ABC-type nitrate/sulfonate/bicarbonate transport system ATPase subunit